ncbi:MAG: alpha/beta fold hydrolase [Candidatus Pacearchaeota archaeon]
MGRKKDFKKPKEVNLKSKSKREFFLIHGYTGDPEDFLDLGDYLSKRFNANVRIPVLYSHDKRVQSLDNLNFEDFLKQLEKELKEELKKGKEIVLGGYSFGGQLALYLAAKYPVKGIFNVSTPLKLRFPFNIKFLEILGLFKKYWKKRNPTPYEKKLNKNLVKYYAHIKGISVTKRGNKLIKGLLSNIKVPSLSIQTKKDYLTNYKSSKVINKMIKSKVKKDYIFNSNTHNIFYSKNRKKAYKIIGDFFENNVFKNST